MLMLPQNQCVMKLMIKLLIRKKTSIVVIASLCRSFINALLLCYRWQNDS